MQEYILPEKEIIDKLTSMSVSFGNNSEDAEKQGEKTVQLIKDLSEFNKSSLEHEFKIVLGCDFLKTREERSENIKNACKSLGIALNPVPSGIKESFYSGYVKGHDSIEPLISRVCSVNGDYKLSKKISDICFNIAYQFPQDNITHHDYLMNIFIKTYMSGRKVTCIELLRDGK